MLWKIYCQNWWPANHYLSQICECFQSKFCSTNGWPATHYFGPNLSSCWQPIILAKIVIVFKANSVPQTGPFGQPFVGNLLVENLGQTNSVTWKGYDNPSFCSANSETRIVLYDNRLRWSHFGNNIPKRPSINLFQDKLKRTFFTSPSQCGKTIVIG